MNTFKVILVCVINSEPIYVTAYLTYLNWNVKCMNKILGFYNKFLVDYGFIDMHCYTIRIPSEKRHDFSFKEILAYINIQAQMSFRCA